MRNALIAIVIAATAGLAAEARADVTLSVSTPDLVYAAPGVQVVADYDDPVFYSDGFYWRFDDGVWYRSNVYYGGWEYWEAPPVYVTRISQPRAFVHYRPRGYVAHYHPIAPRHDAHFVVRPRASVNVHAHANVPARPVVHANVHVNVPARPVVHETVHANVHANVHETVRVQPRTPAHVEAHGHVDVHAHH